MNNEEKAKQIIEEKKKQSITRKVIKYLTVALILLED